MGLLELTWRPLRAMLHSHIFRLSNCYCLSGSRVLPDFKISTLSFTMCQMWMIGWLIQQWGVNHTNHFRHHQSASPDVIVWKVVGQHLFLSIISNNFTAGTGRKVWCDRGMSGRKVVSPTLLCLSVLFQNFLVVISTSSLKLKNWNRVVCFLVNLVKTHYSYCGCCLNSIT